MLKPNETIGDDFPILSWQVKRIMSNCRYQVETKNEWVQWATDDNNRTSLKSITQAQARKIIMTQEGSVPVAQPTEKWTNFDLANPKHKLILSLSIQANWVVNHPKHGQVADLERLDKFLKSDKSPVKKPLKKMNIQELEKIIHALSSIVKSLYK